jgi:adenine modification enzyme
MTGFQKMAKSFLKNHINNMKHLKEIKNYIYDSQTTFFGEGNVVGFGDDSFYLKELDKNEANRIIRENHYSKKIYNGSYIHLGVWMNGDLVGALQYGYAMNPASQNGVVSDTKIDEYLELNRMWLDDIAPKNSESKAISYSIKYIKRKYPKIKWIQSFADERCECFGVVYQACSFDYYGEHTSSFWELDGETFHNSIKTSEKAGPRGYKLLNDPKNKDRVIKHKLRQFRYIKFLDRRCRKKCLLKKQQYPKRS